MSASIKLNGAPELQAIFDHLDKKVQKKLVRHAMRVAAKMILATAKATVSHDTGALRDSLKIKTLARSRNKFGVTVQMPTRDVLASKQTSEKKAARVRSEEGYYPAVIEFGSSKHAARPFLRPALNGNRGGILAAFQEEIKSAVEARGQ